MKACNFILNILMLLILLPSVKGEGTGNIRSIQSEIERTSDQTQKAYLLKQLGKRYQAQGMQEEAMSTFQKLVSIAKNLENSRLEDFALQELGTIYLTNNPPTKKKPQGALLMLMFLLLVAGAAYWIVSKRKETAEKILGQDQKLKEYRRTIEELNSKFQYTSRSLEQENEKLFLKNNELESANEELKKFAYMATHDLKEPLRTIGSYTSLINRRYKDEFDEDGLQFLGFIKDGVNRMHQLLSDVLNYAGLDSNTPELESVNTFELIEELKRGLKSQFDEKNGKLIINELPEIYADKTHLHQIFQNLISNGLKYNDKENPIVLVDCRKKDGFYIFGVHDNGIGLDMAFKDRIFEVFQRLHGKEAFEGTGIGLAIVKKLINHYGGEVWVESEKGQGSKFCFSFPVNQEVLELA